MSTAGDSGGRRHRRGWSQLTPVERVGLYTRQSLYMVLALANAFAVLAAVAQLDGRGAVGVLLAGAAAVTLAAAWAVRVLLNQDAAEPVAPLRSVAPLAGVALAYTVVVAVTLPEAARAPALLVACISVSLAAGLLPDNRLAALVVLASALTAAVHDLTVVSVAYAVFAAVVFLATGRASIWLFDVVRQLDQARRAQSELAVMEERLRFSRDVHDVLGRRLSMIAVQAELAATLAQRGDDRAPEKMLEVRGVAHQALREARELARGYRTTSFPQEVQGARALLRSAGIDVQVSVDTMPHGWQEAAGWVVREAVTNVLRHSDATSVEISFADHRLQIDNDGARPEAAADGAGIDGLRERLMPLGASLSVGPSDGTRWSVVAELPGASPLSAQVRREAQG
ncbi:MAG: hypothetical protein JHD16_06175 [Solirubrobacteraceae bacterium]|nr:hypothetical protein [Solirubrobacteraceae bacterium]